MKHQDSFTIIHHDIKKENYLQKIFDIDYKGLLIVKNGIIFLKPGKEKQLIDFIETEEEIMQFNNIISQNKQMYII